MAQSLQDISIRDRTVRVFDNFYKFNLNVPANEYDVVYAYMRSVCDDDTIAQQFTALLFKISQEIGVNSMQLLQELQGKNAIKMNQTMAYYFNSFKSKTSLYGHAVLSKPNQSVARNIVV